MQPPLFKYNKALFPFCLIKCVNLVLARFGNDWYEYAAESCVNAIPSTPECMQRLIDMEVKKKGAYRHTNGQMKYARKCSPKK